MWWADAARRRPPRSSISVAYRVTRGMSYPADPPRVEEIVAVICQADDGIHGDRALALIIVLWRAGLRIAEALDLREVDLEPARGALLLREGKGGRRREVGMDDWAWERLRPWLEQARRCLPDRSSA